jgi:signal peptidase I
MKPDMILTLFKDYPGYMILGLFILVIGAVGGAKLFDKAGRRWYAAFIPVYNIIEVLRMVGRPVSHIGFLLVPVFNVYFVFKLFIEIAQSFGKYSLIDYILACFFNGFYVLNLALAYNEEYIGPVYGRSHKNVQEREPALV